MKQRFCQRVKDHEHTMLVRDYGEGRRQRTIRTLMIGAGPHYCPDCWREQVATIKKRGLEQARSNRKIGR